MSCKILRYSSLLAAGLLALGCDGSTPGTCAEGTYDRDGECVPWTDCADGEYVSAEPTASSDRQCAACPEGTTSTGPNADACVSDCEDGFFDHDGDVETPCVAWTDCAPGQYVSAPGTS
ncbi:MAG: hypothetical protein JXR96_16205, partial [Deltaproteobacteria bacterium]|nr:hypothetical protein [Deltaproteobacteria bacterium]